ncbi:MAG: hypothetical protein ACRCS3_01715 [Paracoccaceae bacterium]
MSDAADLIARIEQALDSDEAVQLTPREVQKLRQMIAAYEMFLAGGKLGKMFIAFVLGLSALIAASIKLAEYFATATKGGQ